MVQQMETITQQWGNQKYPLFSATFGTMFLIEDEVKGFYYYGAHVTAHPAPKKSHRHQQIRVKSMLRRH